MKTIKHFLAFALMVIATIVSAQEIISPMQLKYARMAAYNWVRDYNVYARMEEKREPVHKFLSLFEDGRMMLPHDYLPLLSKYGTTISATEYASILADRDAVYKMSFEVQNARIVSEKLDGNDNLLMTVEFDKVVSFHERDNVFDTQYAYPDTSYHFSVCVKYNLHESMARAITFTSADAIEEIMVLHNPNGDPVNRYTTYDKLETECREQENSLVKWNYAPADFDAQMVSFHQDTIKNNIHFGGAIGTAFFSAKLESPNFTGLSPNASINYAFSMGYYRQLFLKDKFRLGLDMSLSFAQKNTGIKAMSYNESYDAVDSDGGNYIRLIELSNYNESVKRYAIDIPVALRFDYFFTNAIALFSKLGVSCSYDISQKYSVSADAQYSGYYDWLFDVTITQNGIYDFGAFKFEHTANQGGINHLGINLFAGLGIHYFIPKSRWSVDVGIVYIGEVYNQLLHSEDFHLTRHSQDWQSATYLFKSLYGQNVQFQINCNYNF